MEDINKIIGNNLMRLRKQAKLTQLELAEKFNYTDKSISKWEKGESLPNIEVLYSLAEFYGVTLDTLTSENGALAQQSANTTKRQKLFPVRFIISLIAICAVWVCATALYVGLKISLDINYYMCFIWGFPLSCILSIIFNSIWGKPLYLFPMLSVLIWTTITAFYLQFLTYNLWPLYLLGIPLQAVVIVCNALIAPKRAKKPNPANTEVKPNKKEKKNKVKTEKVQTTETAVETNNINAEPKETKKSEGTITVTLPHIRSINDDKKA